MYVCLYGDLYIGRKVYTNVQITCDAEVVVSSVGGKAASMTAAFGNFAHYIWTFLNAMKQICPICLEIYKIFLRWQTVVIPPWMLQPFSAHKHKRLAFQTSIYFQTISIYLLLKELPSNLLPITFSIN